MTRLRRSHHHDFPPAFIFLPGVARDEPVNVSTRLPDDACRACSCAPEIGSSPTSRGNALEGTDDNARSKIWPSAGVSCSGFHAPLGLNHFGTQFMAPRMTKIASLGSH